MTKNRQKCLLCALAGFITLLLVFLILFVWIVMKHHPTNTIGRTKSTQEEVWQNDALINGEFTTQSTTKKTKEEAPTYLQDLESDVEYVKPMKISTVLMLPVERALNLTKFKDKDSPPYLRHQSGHFRRRTHKDDWDYRPRYEIDTFGKRLELDLKRNDSFLAPNLSITRMDHNYTERIMHDSFATNNLKSCYYSGKVKGDADSYVSVSLCDGMTGVISTSDGSYFIEPAIKLSHSNNLPTNSFIHRIKRIQHSINNNFDNDNPTIHGQQHCDDHEDDLVRADTKNLIRNKRHILLSYDDSNSLEERYHQRTNNEYFIKTFVVVDKSMLDYHQSHEILNHYILVLLSHAALLYKDPSIGNPVSLTVVEILLVNFSFSSNNSQDKRRKFCDWQSKRNESNHDMALLLTRDPICSKNSSKYCDTLGLAEISSMCSRSTGCAIVRENGLSASYTIAHEIGHMLSMVHDSTLGCAKFNSNLAKYNYIMTRVMNNVTKPRSWSECSKHYITDFLSSHRAQCLLQPPHHNYITPQFRQNLPGENFTTHKQCELEFGTDYRECPYTSDQPACHMLWCTSDESIGCKSNQLAWADGTECEDHAHWCYEGACVPRHTLTPLDGGWGAWQTWSGCSRSCGGGVMYRRRECDAPTPRNGGKYCRGFGIEYHWCNNETCTQRNENDDDDFRAVQCRNFRGHLGVAEWLPDYNLAVYDMCKLYCRPKGGNGTFLLREKVIDGTKCGLNSFDVCVDGYCHKGGCDNKLDSDMALDECGVCGGDNSQCRLILGAYNTIAVGYREVLHIPSDSFNLIIWQNATNGLVSDSNYLVLVDGESGRFILNSKTMISPRQKDFFFGGVNISYSGSAAVQEQIRTMKGGKLSKRLILGVLSVGEMHKPNIGYQYMIDQFSAPRYGWRLYKTPWPECSALCSGTQTIHPICINLASGQPEPESNCNRNERDNFIQTQACNTHCQLRWNLNTRGACSVSCGDGYQKINYACIQIPFSNRTSHSIVDNFHCAQIQAPPPSIPCTNAPCPQWQPNNWSTCDCSATTRTLLHSCQSNGQLHPDGACSAPKPQIRQKCACARQWTVGQWSECSTTCGNGYEIRTVNCETIENQPTDNCHNLLKPNSTRSCNRGRCELDNAIKRWAINDQWQYGEWSDCRTPKCEKTRLVACRNASGHYQSELMCQQNLKPIELEKCTPNECYQWRIGAWKQCSKQCGSGERRRAIYCQDLEQKYTLVDSYCQHALKPKSVKRCKRFNCRHVWVEGEWGACSSARCGSGGVQERNVTCHRIFGRGGGGETKEVDGSFCEQRPEMRRACSGGGRCKEGEFVWRAGGWGKCTHECGKRGKMKRDIYCVERKTGRKVSRYHCGKGGKPQRKHKCNQWRCLFKNCRDVQTKIGSRNNRDYIISINNRPARIYCYKMDTNEPEEFISLQGDAINIAENYDKRLKQPDSCPNNGQRDENCDCLEIGPDRAGSTSFWKVRLNVTSLRIQGSDFTFSRQRKGLKVPYGTAGDCFSQLKGCVQARFSIDLRGTSFRLNENVKWYTFGVNASSHINIYDKGRRVDGACGGYCGNCEPDSKIGLQVQLI